MLTCPGLLPAGNSCAKVKFDPLGGKIGHGNQGVLNSTRAASHTVKKGLQERVPEGHDQVTGEGGDTDNTHTHQQNCSPHPEAEQSMRDPGLLVPERHSPGLRWRLLRMPVGPGKPPTLDQGRCCPSPCESPASFEPGEAHIDCHRRARLACRQGVPSQSSTSDETGPGVFSLRNQGVLYIFQECGRLRTQGKALELPEAVEIPSVTQTLAQISSASSGDCSQPRSQTQTPMDSRVKQALAQHPKSSSALA